MAKTNKPIVAVAPGHSFNSGAALLSASALPIATLSTTMAFNDVTFGFVPHGGSSYFLSRLPNELGTYLALTGLPLNGVDAVELKLVDNLVHETFELEYDVADIIKALEKRLPTGYLITDRYQNIPWIEHLKMRQKLEIEEM
jgi:enoyl-CoA hydratase/carnithine racemase